MKNTWVGWIFILMTIFVPVSLVAQQSIISGSVPGAEGKTIELTTAGDYLTYWEKPLVKTVVDFQGQFTLPVNITKTIFVNLSIGFRKTGFFIEPGCSYSLKIAPISDQLEKEVDVLLESEALLVELANPDPDELNMRILWFNEKYDEFLLKNQNALIRDRDKAKIDTFRLFTQTEFGTHTNLFFQDYITYKIASLEQLAQVYGQAQLARRYFSGKPILYDNPEYMDFFSNFFTRYITITSKVLHKVDYQPILKGAQPYNSLMKTLATDTILKNEQFRELVLLKGMMELYRTPDYDKKAIFSVITTIRDQGKFAENRLIAADMTDQLLHLKPGTPAPLFTLQDRNKRSISLKSLQGKPILLCFWTTFCQDCLTEMDIMKSLYSKYRDKVNFVSISVDKEFVKMLYFINLKKDYVWTFLHIGDETQVLKNYDVKFYPLFILLDKSGNIYNYPADLPSKSLDLTLEKILQE